MARRIIAAALAAASLAGCAETVTRDPVPTAMVDEVRPLGLAGLREWGDTLAPGELDLLVATRGPVLQRLFGEEIAAGRTPRLDYLALSGGGQWGAFGAGILRGWSESGTRPEFFGVSGVSTGAIIAPFAFLGPEHDATLEEIYTTYRTEQLLSETVFSGLVSGSALADTSLLAEVIARYVDEDLLAEIAVEHRRGRLLLIGTTNLDAGRPVIWNIGAIAASGHPGALGLVRQLILASASIPVAFPPAIIEVEGADGETWDELHVDGGASSQVTFVSPDMPVAAFTRRALGRNLDRRVWVIVNNDLAPPHATIQPRIGTIGQAAVSSLIRGSGTGDVYRLFAIAERDDIAFNVTWIPPGVACDAPTEEFDPVFMECLYGVGRDLLKEGTLWRDTPPFFVRAPDGAE